MEEELAAEHGNQHCEEEDRMSRETPRWSVGSASSSCKRRKRQEGKSKDSGTSDSFLDMLHEVQGDLKGVSSNVGKMAEALDRKVAIQEKAMNENPQQMLREKAVAELRKLGFTGIEQIKDATVFVKSPDQMNMLLTLDQSLWRELILNMLNVLAVGGGKGMLTVSLHLHMH
ncbi:unnamed protein product [Miscanthus lutarioriparius]|uniref:MLLE-like domain-containing protein n=1 Tax=Miscanthus lutarioriparius TaxID=422564 RepID=A0A811RWJ9_9POAL|nr:unnamed protein product [Miscanthus lutarioriparius]